MADRSSDLAQVYNSAVADFQAGHFAQAEQRCQELVSAKPDFFEPLFLLAIVQTMLGKSVAAVASYDHALALRPDHVDAHYNRGFTLQGLGRLAEALASYDRALSLRPDYLDAHYNRGAVLHALGRFEDALASYDRVLALSADHCAALNNRGLTLQVLGRFEEALASFDRAIASQPNSSEALNNRGAVLQKLHRPAEALASFERVLALKPDDIQALYNRGIALQDMGRYEEALASYDRALLLDPRDAAVLNNRGQALRELMRFDEASMSYQRALAVQPDSVLTHCNNASLQLTLGDLTRGFAEYEWRWKKPSKAPALRYFAQPLWLGDGELAGRTILLHSEQGFGDTIQFCRYAPLVTARGARVILEVERPLLDLMHSLAGVAEVVAKGEPLPPFDLQCPVMSLPHAFATRLETIPATVPYLQPRLEDVQKWEARLHATRRPRIGLAWSGNPAHERDRERSISLRALLPLLDSGASFVSLQKDVRGEDAALLDERRDILPLGAGLRDYADTAALIAQLDLVISVDTSVAHLAGALAKSVWILLTYIPEWRWLLERDDSPWYPSARLFRQDATSDWAGVIARVNGALGRL